MGNDRRNHPRLKFELSVDLDCDHSFFSARTTDISEGGLFIKTSSSVKIGSEIKLAMRVGGTKVRAIGVVIWQLFGDDGKQHGLGVEFRSMSPYARTTIRDFIREHAPEQYGGPAKVTVAPRPAPRSSVRP